MVKCFCLWLALKKKWIIVIIVNYSIKQLWDNLQNAIMNIISFNSQLIVFLILERKKISEIYDELLSLMIGNFSLSSKHIIIPFLCNTFLHELLQKVCVLLNYFHLKEVFWFISYLQTLSIIYTMAKCHDLRHWSLVDLFHLMYLSVEQLDCVWK